MSDCVWLLLVLWMVAGTIGGGVWTIKTVVERDESFLNEYYKDFTRLQMIQFTLWVIAAPVVAFIYFLIVLGALIISAWEDYKEKNAQLRKDNKASKLYVWLHEQPLKKLPPDEAVKRAMGVRQ